MTGLVFAAIVLLLGWSVWVEGRRRHRWREAERLSRCMFAAAGMRRRHR